VQEGGRVSRGHAHEDEEKQHGRQQAAAVGRREEAEHREDHRDDRHGERLHARAHEHREHHRGARRPKDVAMHELPARLLLDIIRRVAGIVPVKVAVERAHHNHRHHAREEEDDHQRVDDRKPVDLLIAHQQVRVPPRRPLDLARLPLDVVRENHLAAAGAHSERHRARRAAARRQLRLRALPRAAERVLDGGWLDLETNDPRAIEALVLVVFDREEQVVVEVRHALLGARDVGRAAEAKREAEVIDGERLGWVGLVHVLGRGGQVVHDPVHAVVLLDTDGKLLALGGGELLFAQDLARLLHAHLELVVRVHDLVAAEHFAEVLCHRLQRFRLAEGQHVVLVRQLRLGGRELVDLQIDPFSRHVVARRDARQVEGARRAEKQADGRRAHRR